MRVRSPRAAVFAIAAAVVLTAGAVVVAGAHDPMPVAASGSADSALAAGPAASSVDAALTPAGSKRYQPNVVVIVADDLDSSLVQYMPNVQKLRKRGADFRRHFVVDSLCCSSRSSFLTGMYPHNSKVFNNITGPDPAHPVGGYAAWVKAKNDTKTFAYEISKAAGGYNTGFFGKFINRYSGSPGSAVPAGWDTFNVMSTSRMYAMWGYPMTSVARSASGARVIAQHHYGVRDRDYSTDVLRRMSVAHINRVERAGKPYFVEIAPTATHSAPNKRARKGDAWFPAAPRDLPLKGKKAKKNPKKRYGDCGTKRCERIDVRKLPGFNASRAASRPRYADGRPAPMFGPTKKLARKKVKAMQKHHRNRARMAQSLDDLVGAVMRSVGPDTYIVFTSDNGYHLGHKRLTPGKSSAYDTDIRVPLIVAGPGVVPGPRYQVVQNIDLAPTFEQIAGLRPAARRDGQSLLPILRAPRTPGPRFAFIEHTRPGRSADDPDGEGWTPVVPSYVAVRSADKLLVRYDTRAGDPAGYTFEYYRGLSRKGAWERTNVYTPTDPEMQTMLRRLEQFKECEGASCLSLAR
ncbi:sulfatase [Mumia zhuanghuii]|uniref:Sulfatase n=2 Tax=Mumia TaxID=1546255 RepID=A0ABW1QJL3_9ACTN|nr:MULTISPECIES: sulfatase [Mumia]KAA1418405.1 sulfatase [Mumia zhuanghuii]